MVSETRIRAEVEGNFPCGFLRDFPEIPCRIYRDFGGFIGDKTEVDVKGNPRRFSREFIGNLQIHQMEL